MIVYAEGIVYTLKYMILRQSILSIDKIFKEITVSECENAKIF